MNNNELDSYFESLTNFDNLAHYLNPTQGKYLLLPVGFGVQGSLQNITSETNISCPVLRCMIKDKYDVFTKNNSLNIKTFKLYEKYLLFVSILYRRYNKAKKRNPNTDDAQDDLPLITLNFSSTSKNNLQRLMAGMNRTLVSEMINFFMTYKFIFLYETHDFLPRKGESSILKTTKAARYLLGNQFDRAISRYYFKTDQIVKNLNKKHITDIEQLQGDDVVDYEKELLNDKTIRSFTFPSNSEVIAKARELVDSGETDKHGRQYVWEIPSEWMHPDNGKEVTITNTKGITYTYTIRGKLKAGCPFVDINTHINNYLLMINGSKTVKARVKFECEGVTYYDRFYYDLSLMTSWIRNLIKIDNEPLRAFDATALHPRLVGAMYSEKMNKPIPEFLKDDAHSKIASLLGITRSEAKQVNLTYWNSRISRSNKTIASKKNEDNFRKLDSYIQENHPDLWEYLVEVKIRMNCIKNNGNTHSNMSVLLNDAETRLMQNIISKASKHSSVIYCYDCIYVKESVWNEVENLFKQGIEKVMSSHEISKIFDPCYGNAA